MQPYTSTTRTRLEEVRDRKRKARDGMARARKAIDAAGSDEQARHAAEMVLANAQGEESLAAEIESTMLSQLAGAPDDFGSSFLDNPDMVRELEQLASSAQPFGQINLGPVSSRESFVASIQSGTWGGRTLAAFPSDVGLPDDSRAQAPYGIRQQLRRTLSILDLCPTSTMEALSFQYTQEASPSGAPSGTDSFSSASEVAEGTLKPQSSIGLVDAEVTACTIATWYRLRRQQLADVPGLATTINSRLIYAVLRRLENQILIGDGSSGTIKGILAQPGVGDVPYAPSGVDADQALSGIVDVLNAEAQPNAVCISPTDWGNLLAAKSVGSGEYVNELGPFIAQARNLWGTDVIVTTAMPVGQILVGDFSQCTVFVREAPLIRLSDSDQDNFVKNNVTALGEGRFGLAVWAPGGFALVHLTA